MVAPPATPPDPDHNDPDSGDPSNLSTGCYLDGVNTPCDWALQALNSGEALIDLHNPGAGLNDLIRKGILIPEIETLPRPKPYQDTDSRTISAITGWRLNGEMQGIGMDGGSPPVAPPSSPQEPVPFPGTDAIKNRLNTGDCNAYIASLIAKAAELSGGKNPAVAKDGLDLLGKISSQGGFVLKDHLKVGGYPAGGTVSGAVAGGQPATVLISTRFMYGNSASTVRMWQGNYIDTAIHEMLHLSGRYSGYSDTELAAAASKLPGASSGLPAAPTGPNDMNGILNNSGYFDRELMKHCGGKK